MWPNLQFPTDLVIFTEEILNEKLHFLCSVHFFVLILIRKFSSKMSSLLASDRFQTNDNENIFEQDLNRKPWDDCRVYGILWNMENANCFCEAFQHKYLTGS